MTAVVQILAILLAFGFCFAAADSVLKCWRCSTDVSNGAFCDDPFDPEYISDQQRYWSYVNCSYTTGYKTVNARPVCKKLVQEVYGKRVISRSCFYEDYDRHEEMADRCGHETSSSYIKTIFCQTCSTDGCNAATAYAPQVTSLLLPALLLLLLKLLKSK